MIVNTGQAPRNKRIRSQFSSSAVHRLLSVRNVPQASDVGSVRREGSDGGRLAVQVEDKLVKVRNMKVRPSLQPPALSKSLESLLITGCL